MRHLRHLKEYKLWSSPESSHQNKRGFSIDTFGGLGGSIPRDLWMWRGISIVPPKK